MRARRRAGSGEGFLTGDAVNTAARLQAAAPPMAVARRRDHPRPDHGAPSSTSRSRRSPLKGKARAGAVLAREGHQLPDGDRPGRGLRHAVRRPRDRDGLLTALLRRRRRLVVPQARTARRRARHRQVAAWSPSCFRYVDGRPGLMTLAPGRLPVVRRRRDVLGARRDRQGARRDPRDGRPGDGASQARRRRSRRRTGRGCTKRLRPLVGLAVPQGDRDENFAAWSAFVEALAASTPTVLVIDDLHWADEACSPSSSTSRRTSPTCPSSWSGPRGPSSSRGAGVRLARRASTARPLSRSPEPRRGGWWRTSPRRERPAGARRRRGRARSRATRSTPRSACCSCATAVVQDGRAARRR